MWLSSSVPLALVVDDFNNRAQRDSPDYNPISVNELRIAVEFEMQTCKLNGVWRRILDTGRLPIDAQLCHLESVNDHNGNVFAVDWTVILHQNTTVCIRTSPRKWIGRY